MFGFVTDSIAECSGCKMVYNLHSPPDPEMVFLIDLSQAKQNQPLEDLIYTNLNSTRSMKCHSGACTDTGEKACEEFISVPPEVLIISLNRFRMTKSKKPSIRKVSTKIDFKHRLDLARHYGHRGLDRNSELNYCLTSVIWHRGSLSSGHYMVTAKDPGVKDNTWRLFNDSTVSSVPRGQALDLPSDHPTQKWTAYVLTYLRCPDDKRESTKITSGSRALDQIRQAVEAAL